VYISLVRHIIDLHHRQLRPYHTFYTPAFYNHTKFQDHILTGASVDPAFIFRTDTMLVLKMSGN